MALAIRTNRLNGIDFDQVVNRWLGAEAAPVGHPVDVRQDADHFYVDVELAGFGKDDVVVTVENQTLTITADKPIVADDGKTEWVLRERRPSKFARSFTLPRNVADQDVNARMENGVLTVTLKKREESKPRKISVA